MTPGKKRAIEILEQVFESMTRDEKARVQLHLEEGTPIVCGRHSSQYFGANGGG